MSASPDAPQTDNRGAYTARAVVGLIANQGLLNATKLDVSDKRLHTG